IYDTYYLAYGFGRKLSIAIFFADRVFPGKIFLREGLVDHGDPGSGGVVCFGQEAATQQPRMDRREEVRCDRAIVDFVVFAAVWFANEANPIGVAVTAHR